MAGSPQGAVASAAWIVRVGAATAPRLALTGEVLPAAHPHVAAALRSGNVSVESASAITGMLDRVAPRADASQADAVEAVLAERAADLPHDLMMKVIVQAEARLDQDGLAPQEEELYDRWSLRITEDRTGAVKLTACLDPETGAMVKAAIESLVTNMIRTERAGGVADPGASALSKFAVDDWTNGTAEYNIKRNPPFGDVGMMSDITHWITSAPLGTIAMTWGAILIEIAIGLGMLLSERWRVFALVLDAFLHVSIVLTMGLWSFSLVMVGSAVIAANPSRGSRDRAGASGLRHRSNMSLLREASLE